MKKQAQTANKLSEEIFIKLKRIIRIQKMVIKNKKSQEDYFLSLKLRKLQGTTPSLSNKKGAEGFSWTLMMLILGGIILVVLVLGYTGALSKIFSLGNAVPAGNLLEEHTQRCIIDVKSNLMIDYCTYFSKLTLPGESQESMINCQYSVIEDAIKAQGYQTIICGGDAAKTYCITIAQQANFKDINVNGVLCSKNTGGTEISFNGVTVSSYDGNKWNNLLNNAESTTCVNLGGTWLISGRTCSIAQMTNDLTVQASDKTQFPNQVCCK